jgi:hypothetical protein
MINLQKLGFCEIFEKYRKKSKIRDFLENPELKIRKIRNTFFFILCVERANAYFEQKKK